jgi:hypothetical protein
MPYLKIGGPQPRPDVLKCGCRYVAGPIATHLGRNKWIVRMEKEFCAEHKPVDQKRKRRA